MFELKLLPPKHDLESKSILKQCIKAHKALAQLRGISQSIPDQGMLINTLGIQEAKDSSEIEAIITTHDALFRHDRASSVPVNAATKEVSNYVLALGNGFKSIKQKDQSRHRLHI